MWTLAGGETHEATVMPDEELGGRRLLSGDELCSARNVGRERLLDERVHAGLHHLFAERDVRSVGSLWTE